MSLSCFEKLVLIGFAALMGFQGFGFMWEHKHKPTWQDRVLKAVGMMAWGLGILTGILKAIVYYATGPVVVYLMVRYLT